MTEKLYYTDSHMYEFSANILSVENKNGYNCIVLDATAFFPGGGGQACDTGTIENVKVINVFEENEIIYHCVENNSGFEKGEPVFCKIDAQLRFSRMQAHSAEHIVSGIAHSLFGVENVGFHSEGDILTVDFDKPLAKENLEEIENRANRCVYSNVNIVAKEYSALQAAQISYRSKLDFTGSVRIVEIDGIDKCACCAVHVNSTGEIGIIKILSSVSHRGGVRITMLGGMAAYRDYVEKYRQTMSISAMLCAKHNETDIAVRQLLDSSKELKSKLNEQKSRYLKFIASQIAPSDFLCEFFEDLDMSELIEFIGMLKAKSCNNIFIFSGDDENGYTYCICYENDGFKDTIKEFNIRLNGNGGGKPPIAQGKCKATRNEITQYIEEMRVNMA